MNGPGVAREDDEAFPDVPSVERGGTPQAQINYLSVSQLKTAKLCLRKWWLKKVADLDEPESASLEIGKQVHAELEHYLREGEDVLGEIARAALPYLPQPKGDYLVEAPITKNVRPIEGALVQADGIPLVGFIDRVQDAGSSVWVTDYKTSGNPKKWGSTKEQLTTTEHEHGIQMVGYALAGFEMFPDASVAHLEHLTLHKKPTKVEREAGEDVRQTVASISPKQARDEWERMNLLARELRKVAKVAKVEDTPSAWGTEACDAYGGCHFFGTCVVAEAKRSQPVEKQKMSLKDLLAKRNTAQGPSAGSIPVGNPPQSAEAPKGEGSPPGAEVKAEPLPQVVPPDAPKSDPAKAAEPPPAPVEEKPKGKRGPKPKADAPDPEKILVDDVNGFSLYIDCVPQVPGKPIGTVDLASYVNARVGEIMKAFPDLIDIRNAPKKGPNAKGEMVDHPLAFGGWKGVLAAQCKLTPPKGTVIAQSYGEVSQVAIEALEPLAMVVVRGVR